ncbi:hypothetical protein HJB78_27165 [Rhizobium lentis]|uniref:hypothetical protein n=1 Tax=Rhizobium lentis TaxID=1138194 RepID=UPI001C82CBB0|nr:hypothetical protein [Rhizobium lentis]MBX5154596.1 hypothetical protein [Rhizobium lentis]
MSRPDRPCRLKKVCKRKIAYFSQAEAVSAAEEVKAAGKLYGADFAVYECRACFHFHWGNILGGEHVAA